MEANYLYVLKQCKRFALGGKILDYGCGSGDIVQAGQQSGLDIVGVEAFYGGSHIKDTVIARGLLNISVFPLSEDYHIPFTDGFFDLVVSNQVMEHVENLDLALCEISRVLKPTGKLLTLFPSKSVIREGHCGIPFAHWFSGNSRARYLYMRLMRGIGLGYFKEGKTQQQWVLDFMEWLDKYTVYRPYEAIQLDFIKNKFAIKHIEDDYINFRLQLKGFRVPDSLQSMTIYKIFSSTFCRLLGGMVILVEKTY